VDIFNPYKLRQPIRMQGQQYDEESGLHYNRHRYYDPALGRYITQDPIGLSGGINGYEYVHNKPLEFADPLGLTVEFQGDLKTKTELSMAYDKVGSTKHGKEMISKMLASEHNYIIRGLKPDDEKYKRSHRYVDNEFTIYIDINDHSTVKVKTKFGCKEQESPIYIILAHEIGHVMGTKDDGPGFMSNVKSHENPVREEMGLPPRVAY
ncbi:RHS repeat-associated core domain-containing protein, partial [Rahnella selenatireducens]|uniref:RHS repeat-associated core domain-containing protein n=1 Tax=Rahnella selenatireducens TaxID=3389797 RepID=UPI0039689FB8